MSKAQHIRALDAQGLPPREIAAIVGCSPDYVRVAARQRKHGTSNADKAYAAANKPKIKQRYKEWAERTRAEAPEYWQGRNAKCAAYRRQRYRSDPMFRELRKAQSQIYRAERATRREVP